VEVVDMTLSKKYYIRFALILSESKTLDEAINKFCDMFEADNNRFNKSKFRKACEVKKQ